jgi:hypothetical protein
MAGRVILLSLAGVLACGVSAVPASAGDFGISFHYSTSALRYGATRCYTTCVPRTYVYYESYPLQYVYCDAYACDSYACDYYEPVVYVAPPTRRVVVHERSYPTTYRTTYSRTYYRPPARHLHGSVYYRSGDSHRHYRHHERHHVTYRHSYSKPRPSYRHHERRDVTYRHSRSKPRPKVRAYSTPSRSHYRHAGSSDRPRLSVYKHGPSDSRRRYYRPHKSVRILRRR